MSFVPVHRPAAFRARAVWLLPPRWLAAFLLLAGLTLQAAPAKAVRPDPVPDKTVVLTFDDSVASQALNVVPALRQAGFGATFFITEGFSFLTNKQDYLTWEQIRWMHRAGFEIGNHTRDHLGVSADTLGRLREQVEAINARCAEHGIPRPVSFAYPGNAIHPGALPLLREMGFRYARRGAQPEFAYETGKGIAYEPGVDDPLLIPTTGDARPVWTLDDLKRAVSHARDGRIAVLQFHGVPDREHPWVNTPATNFLAYVRWLRANGYRGIALRDVGRFLDPAKPPSADPWAVIRRRQEQPEQRARVQGAVVDAATGRRIEAWLRVRDASGRTFLADSALAEGTSRIEPIRPGKDAAGRQVRLSAHPFELWLPPGRYELQAARSERGPAATQEIVIGSGDLEVHLAVPGAVTR